MIFQNSDVNYKKNKIIFKKYILNLPIYIAIFCDRILVNLMIGIICMLRLIKNLKKCYGRHHAIVN